MIPDTAGRPKPSARTGIGRSPENRRCPPKPPPTTLAGPSGPHISRRTGLSRNERRHRSRLSPYALQPARTPDRSARTARARPLAQTHRLRLGRLGSGNGGTDRPNRLGPGTRPPRLSSANSSRSKYMVHPPFELGLLCLLCHPPGSDKWHREASHLLHRCHPGGLYDWWRCQLVLIGSITSGHKKGDPFGSPSRPDMRLVRLARISLPEGSSIESPAIRTGATHGHATGRDRADQCELGVDVGRVAHK